MLFTLHDQHAQISQSNLKNFGNFLKSNILFHFEQMEHFVATIHHARKRKITNGMTLVYEKYHKSVMRRQIFTVTPVFRFKIATNLILNFEFFLHGLYSRDRSFFGFNTEDSAVRNRDRAQTTETKIESAKLWPRDLQPCRIDLRSTANTL